MKILEFKKLIKEAVMEVLHESYLPVLKEYEAWAKDVIGAKKYTGSSGGTTYTMDESRGTFAVSFYQYNFATVQMYLNIPRNLLQVELYFDSGRDGYLKKYELDQSELAKKDFMEKVSSIKRSPFSDRG